MRLTNKHVFLTVLGAGTARFKTLVDVVSGKGPLPRSQKTVFLLCLYLVLVSREISGVSIIRARVTPQGPHFQIPSLPARSLRYECWENTDVQSGSVNPVVDALQLSWFDYHSADAVLAYRRKHSTAANADPIGVSPRSGKGSMEVLFHWDCSQTYISVDTQLLTLHTN